MEKVIRTKRQSIVFTEADRAELLEEELSEPGDDEVQVNLAVSTLSSGTERANLIGDATTSIYSNDPVAHFPRRSGYSSSGTVVEAGKNVKNVKPGDRVSLIWSTHSSTVNIKADRVFKLPDSVSFENGALMFISSFPLAAIRKCSLEAGESAIVMGLGILGLCAVPLLRTAGAVPVIAVDPVPEKREKALASGADYALDPFDKKFADRVKNITGGGANVAVEVTGNGGGLNGVLDCMAKFGRVALLGCTRHSDFTVDYYRKVHGPGITLVGAHTAARPKAESRPGFWTEADDVKALIKLTDYGRLNLQSLTDETHSPAEATEVYKRLAENPAFPVTQFDWRLL